MSEMWMLALVCLGVGMLVRPSGGLAPPKSALRPVKPPKCDLERTYGMLGASCVHLDLSAVPDYLNTDIQVLDMTFNRLRELLNTSFINYSSLRFLYLEDNSISSIELGAFTPIPDLEVLDLRFNSLHTVPEALKSLPVLRKLYLDRNPFQSVLFYDPLPSVEQLGLSECRLRQMPGLEALPRLLTLNVSYNRIKSLNVRDLAPLCRLRDLDLRGNMNLFVQPSYACDCSLVVEWSFAKGIKVRPQQDTLCRAAFDAVEKTFDNATCHTNATDLLFQESNSVVMVCEEQVLGYGNGPIRIKNSIIWTVGIFGACAILIICVASVYCARRRHSNRQRVDDGSSEGSRSLKSKS